MATLTNINKSSADVYLAADDGRLIFDDNDNTYLMVSIGAALVKMAKSVSHLIYTRILESSETIKTKILRITEDGEKRLLEDSPSDTEQSITKNTATLTKILKS